MTTEREKLIAGLRRVPSMSMYASTAHMNDEIMKLREQAADMLAADGAQSEPVDHSEVLLDMVTDLEITELAHRTASRCSELEPSEDTEWLFDYPGLIDFARKLLAKGGAK